VSAPVTPSIDLTGRVALVTGASKGIGRAIAAAFAGAGARVMLSARNPDRLNETAAELPGEIETFPANAGDPVAAAACVEATLHRLGAVDILVNNAATNPHYGPLIEIDVPRWDKIMATNLRGPLVWTQEVWRTGMAERGGSVINIASVGGLHHGLGIGAYNVSKAGLIHQTRILAAELGPAVRVNAIAPGLIKTDFSQVLVDNHGEALAQRIPTRRLGESEDVAGAALWLASDLASWITGQVIVVDGGGMLV
jgi:NAD(P)-dependent dehydrogenase (short-subunit alcohol dehydrogenase family)